MLTIHFSMNETKFCKYSLNAKIHFEEFRSINTTSTSIIVFFFFFFFSLSHVCSIRNKFRVLRLIFAHRKARCWLPKVFATDKIWPEKFLVKPSQLTVDYSIATIRSHSVVTFTSTINCAFVPLGHLIIFFMYLTLKLLHLC